MDLVSFVSSVSVCLVPSGRYSINICGMNVLPYSTTPLRLHVASVTSPSLLLSQPAECQPQVPRFSQWFSLVSHFIGSKLDSLPLPAL